MAELEMLGRVPLLQLSDVADHRQPAARHLRQSLISGYTQLVSFVIRTTNGASVRQRWRIGGASLATALRFSERTRHHRPPHMNGRPNSAASVACVWMAQLDTPVGPEVAHSTAGE